MKISWNWLKRHLDLEGLDPWDVANRFTMSVAELEGVEELGTTASKVLTARVKSVTRHEKSDKLMVLEVDLGDRVVTAVSTAPNIRPGIVFPFATPGAVLEGVEGKPVVSEVEFKGVRSLGVTCSEKELGISQDHTGLLEFPEGTPVGVRLTDFLPLHDFVFEIDNKSITHRPDLWGHRGVAREIGALVGRKLLPFDVTIPKGPADPLKVRVEVPELCPRYTALVFDGVRVGQSPLWLKVMLNYVGVRPINNVVDLTNFVMLDVGNPTHAFDARFLASDTIVVRRGLPGETLRTLDNVVRDLSPDDVVIADGERAVALGGVMGGENSQIREDTTRVVLEAACFNPTAIRRTSARLGLRTEASARFEKGLDLSSPIQATALFARLMQEVCPSSFVASRFYCVSVPEPEPTVIKVSPAFIRRRLGVDLPDQRMREILESLEFKVAVEGSSFLVTVPSFRAVRDVKIPVDIVEEVGRIYGYHNIRPVPLLAPVAPPPVVVSKQVEETVRDVLSACGYIEVMSYSFDSSTVANQIGYFLEGAVELVNPISSDLPVLRRHLMPNLLVHSARNSLFREDFRIFECGRVFFPAPRGGEIPHQERHVAGIICSRTLDNQHLYRLARGHVEAMLAKLGRSAAIFVPPAERWNVPWAVPGKARSVVVGQSGAECGLVSILNPLVRDALKLRSKAAWFEVDLEPLISAPKIQQQFEPLPRHPAIQNDLSVIVDAAVPYQKVYDVIVEAGGRLLEKPVLFATFSGPPIPEGKKSLSFHLSFRSRDRTLQDEEVQPLVENIMAQLASKVGGEVRR